MKKSVMKRVFSIFLAMLLTMTLAPVTASAEEREDDLMAFSSAFLDMLDSCYGLEGPEPEVSLAGTENEEYQTARLIVKAAGDIDRLDAVAEVSGYDDLHVLQYADAASAREAARIYAAMPGVEYVEADRLYTVDDPAPGEWAEASESTEPASEGFRSWGYGPDYMNMSAYHNWLLSKKGSVSRLSNVVVAVVDSGVMKEHEFLREHLVNEGYDFIGNDDEPDDENGHGTHVSGTVVDGTLDNVKVLPVRVLNEKGQGTTMQIVLGIRYAIEKNVDVINMSLGGAGERYSEQEAVNEAVKAGITVVVSAGNDNSDAAGYSPAHFDNVITVAAAGQDWDGDGFSVVRADFSNFGECVDITAPGVSIESSVPYDPADEYAWSYEAWNGTSMASPHIAAAAAMLLSAHPEYTPEQVRMKLVQAATIPVRQCYDWYYDELDGIDVPNMPDMAMLTDDPAGQKELSISRTEAHVCPGQTFRLEAMATPAASVSWRSSDSSVASVASDGTVTCHKEGTAMVTVTANGARRTCAVTVAPLEITLSETRILPVGGNDYLAVETNCDPAPELTWTCDSPNVSIKKYMKEYPESGWEPGLSDDRSSVGIYVVGEHAGEAVVTAGFGGDTAQCRVTVEALGGWTAPVGGKYLMKTEKDLRELAYAIEYEVFPGYFAGKTVSLENDIALSNEEWDPISDFSGTFEGNGHTISNMCMHDAVGSRDGFFSTVNTDGEVRYLKVEGTVATSETEDRQYMGGIAGYNEGTIFNCEFSGSVTAENREGVGGITGYNSGVVEQCANHGTVTGGTDVGGIVGYNEGSAMECVNSGDVTGVSYVGGISGYHEGITLEDCWNEGTITGTETETGGICGYMFGGRSEIDTCLNFGDVTGGGYHTGGIVGCATVDEYNWRNYVYVKNCLNGGFVSGADATGGICGKTEAEVLNCVNMGTVSGNDGVGGLYGYGGYSVMNCVNYGAVIRSGTQRDEWPSMRNCADFWESVYYYGIGNQIPIKADGKTLSKSVTVGSLYTGNEVLSVMNYYVCNEYVRDRTNDSEPLYPLCFWKEYDSVFLTAAGVVLERDGRCKICQTVYAVDRYALEELRAVAAGYDANGKMSTVVRGAPEQLDMYGAPELGYMLRLQMDAVPAETRVFVLDAATGVPQSEVVRVR